MDEAKKILIAKSFIYVIAGLKIVAGLVAGWIFPSLGGHGVAPLATAAPFMLIGGLVGGILAFISILAANFLERENRLAGLYVYAWCGIAIVLGMSLRIPGIPLIIVGIYVWIIKSRLSGSPNSESP